MANYTVSPKGIAFIKSFEKGPSGGAALTPYFDKQPHIDPKSLLKPPHTAKSLIYLPAYGYLTIGWGHKVTAHDSFDVLSVINSAQADSLFMQDLKKKALNIINVYVRVPLTQGQVDALASYVFNTGSLINTNLLTKLNNKDYAAAKEQMDIITCDHKPLNGLKIRREAEKKIWDGGNYVNHN